MKWSEEKVKQLHDLAFASKSNKEIANQLGIGINEVYAKRSQLGITIPKVKAAQAGVTSPKPRQAIVKPISPPKRTAGEITYDLRLQLRALSSAIEESHILIVELFDVLGLLDSTSQ